MRTLLLCAAIFLSPFVIAENIDINAISKKIDTLKESKKIPPVVGYDVYDPFLKAKPLLAQKEEKPIVATRRAITIETILNKKALIEGRWLGVGDHLRGTTITAVHDDHIVMGKEHKTFTIFLQAKKSIITTKERSQ